MRIDGVVKTYGAATVLSGADLRVNPGFVVTIRGPNGSGKSTLLRIAATLTKPTRGEIEVMGVDALSQSAQARMHIGAVMHSPMLYSELTVHENLTLFATLCQLSQAETRVDTVERQLGLTERIGDRASKLSHGYRKRVAIARAILHQPPLLLLDEPETGLDDEGSAMLTDVVRTWRNKGGSVVVATHSHEFLAMVADTAYEMRNGQIAQIDVG